MKLWPLLFLAALIGCSAKSADPNISCEAATFETTSYQICQAPSHADIRLFWGIDDKPFGSFNAVNKHLSQNGEGLRFAMNGALYHESRQPVGLYIEGDMQRQTLKRGPSYGNFGLVPNGVFYIDQNGPAILETEKYLEDNIKPQYATQSGPLLVEHGKLHPKFVKDSSSRKIRNGVGISSDGQTVYFVKSETAVNFHSFARLFRDHLNAPNALYLDGTVSRLYDPAQERNDPGVRMGPIIGVVK